MLKGVVIANALQDQIALPFKSVSQY
jgi:hypothetical protein